MDNMYGFFLKNKFYGHTNAVTFELSFMLIEKFKIYDIKIYQTMHQYLGVSQAYDNIKKKCYIKYCFFVYNHLKNVVILY